MTTDDDRDERVSARYRELGRAEPRAEIDDAILAASRRAVHAGPAKASVRRWALPVSLAAAVMLSVLVTLNVREERPDLELPVYESPDAPAPAVPVAPEPEAAPAAAARSESRSEAVPAPSREVVRADKPESSAPPQAERSVPRFVPEPPRESAPVAATAGAGAAVSGKSVGELAAPPPTAAPSAPRAMSRPAPAEMRDRAEAMAKRAEQVEENAADAETPERMLERIAGLRVDGKHEEADKLLADFRRRHPQYRIPDAMLERVERPR